MSNDRIKTYVISAGLPSMLYEAYINGDLDRISHRDVFWPDWYIYGTAELEAKLRQERREVRMAYWDLEEN